MSDSEHEPLDALDEHARTWLVAYTRAESMPHEMRERLLERVHRDLDGYARRANAPRKLAIGITLALAAAIVLVAGLGANLLRSRRVHAERSDEQAQHSTPDRDVQRARSGIPNKATSEPGERLPSVLVPASASASAPAPESSLPSSSWQTVTSAEPKRLPAKTDTAAALPSPADAFAEELSLVRTAQIAINAKQYAHVLALVDELERRFPNGGLVQERSALRVLALCGGGNLRQGTVEAERFMAAHPKSTMVARVRDACEER